MRSVRLEYIKFVKKANKILSYINFNSPAGYLRNPNRANVYIYACGILNALWQSWNIFWRALWMTYFLGGYDIKNNKILPSNTINSIANQTPYRPQNIIRPSRLHNEKEVAHYILYLLGKKGNPNGTIVSSYQEPTWGDIDIINKISSSVNDPGNHILNALGAISNAPKHFQYVRNAAIHFDKDNIQLLVRHVVPYYVIAKIKYPTDIIFSIEQSSGKYALISWMDEITALIQLI